MAVVNHNYIKVNTTDHTSNDQHDISDNKQPNIDETTEAMEMIKQEKKQELKNQILVAASNAFINNGIRAVKMDDIAAMLKISKRTLYQIYTNKLELVRDVMKKLSDDNRASLREYALQCDNVMDILIEYFHRQTAFYRSTNKAFFNDIKKYPELTKILKELRHENTQYSRDFFVRGVEEGFFRKDVNYDLLSNIGRDLFVLQHNDEYQKFEVYDVFQTIICTIIRGICTAKGIMQVDDFLEKLSLQNELR